MTARILVVDDEPDLEVLIQRKFRHQIRDGAVSFLFASDGVEALTVLKANCDVDMVITDINMPRMDGLLLLQNLQESEEKLSTIIVSAANSASTAFPVSSRLLSCALLICELEAGHRFVSMGQQALAVKHLPGFHDCMNFVSPASSHSGP